MGSHSGYSDGRETAPQAPPPKGIVRDYTETILVCVVFVIFTRAFVFQQSKIPSGSMLDTLLIGDYIMVNRFVYSPWDLDWERRLLPERDLKHGEVVVFKYPVEPEIDYIKRVVGLPGDRIEVRDGRLYRNGRAVVEPYLKADPARASSSFGPEVVRPDHFFMMGDNRNSSYDSRAWGQVPREMIKGRALLIWWSYEEAADDVNLKGVDRLRSMGSKLVHLFGRSRWSRCFSLIR